VFLLNKLKNLPASIVLSMWPLACFSSRQGSLMLKISITDTRCKRTLLVEGKLVPPWTGELQRAWREANRDLEGREPAIDLRNVTAIGPEGENTLCELMKEGAKFTCAGVLTKHVLKQLARKSHSKFRDILISVTGKSEA